MSGKMVCFAASADGTVPMVSYYGIDLAVISVHQLTELVDLQFNVLGGLSSLREIQAGGAKINNALYSKVRSVINCPILNTYASTEAGTAAVGNIDRLGTAREQGCVGILTPWVSVSAISDDGIVRERGKSGRLRIHTIGLAPEYEIGMKKVISPEYFEPGDIGYVSENRQLFIEGRESELINLGGNKFSPERIEALVLECRGVKEAAAFAIDANHDLPQICVYVVGDSSIDQASIIKHCAEKSRIITPSIIRKVDVLPRNETGKIQYQQLREMEVGKRA
jgi:acyl-coenzyme A synthetase/AMP-(fatty) acid ligase